MKYIQKIEEPQILSDFKNNFKKKHHIYAKYEDMTSDVRVTLKSALLEEQHAICCYCMKRIKENNSHIEHIKPQSKFKTETLDYHNMVVSCNGIQDSNEHCGHKKDNWYNAQEFLTPLNADCEKVFTYNITGEMDAASKNGKITINKLNLNSLLLIRARKAIIALSGLFDKDFLLKKRELIKNNSTPNSKNELPSFCMAVIYCISNY